jgi:hypothetical protein
MAAGTEALRFCMMSGLLAQGRAKAFARRSGNGVIRLPVAPCAR